MFAGVQMVKNSLIRLHGFSVFFHVMLMVLR